ncbi:MAG TPA: FAD-dependent oxidoreductase [Burkholderiaceae bacterium]|nr:FAD-dependent oxidoreductase [Burkholderiaceae bacterium]
MGQGASITRRAALVAGVGVPWLAGALGGCARDDRIDFDGAWLGGSHLRGHRVRDGATPVAAARHRTDVVIVGVGVAGLACARALERRGIGDFVLLELEDRVGGNSRGHALGGSRCPLGAHYLPVPGPDAHEVSELLFDLGLLRHAAGRTVAEERHLCHSPQERLFFEGAWHDGLLPPAEPGSRTWQQYRAFAREVDRVQRELAFALPTQRAAWTDGHRALDAVPFESWLAQHGFDNAQLLWMLDYACRDDYGAGVSEVSAWAGLHYFASRHGFSAPGDDTVEREPVFTWPEGNAWLVERIVEPLRTRVHSAHTVLQVNEERHGVQVLAFDEQAQQAVAFDARAVVLAVPLFIARRLLRAAVPALDVAAASVRYAPWLVANLQLRAPLLDRAIGAPPAWDNVRYGAPSLGYVSAQHQSLRANAQATVLTAYWALPSAERATLLGDDWRPWARRVIDDLAVAHPDLPGKAQRIELMRYGHAMRVPVPGARGDPALGALASLAGRVQFAHADLSAYSVFEEAYTHGVRAAAAVAAALRRR